MKVLNMTLIFLKICSASVISKGYHYVSSEIIILVSKL